MNKLLLLFVLFENIFASDVILTKNEYQSIPNTTSFQLKCVYNLEKDKQSVQKVDISKDKKVFYSVEYSPNHGNGDHVNHEIHEKHEKHQGNHTKVGPNTHLAHNYVEPKMKPSVVEFKKVSGIRELQRNVSEINRKLNEGWTSVNIKLFNEKPLPGTYRCKVHYFEDQKQYHIESDKVFIYSKRGLNMHNHNESDPHAQPLKYSISEEVKFKLNHGHERFRRNKNIQMECKYKLLKNDKFRGLSLLKDNMEFFRFFNTKNHSFVPIQGINKISWSSYAKSVHLTVKKAQNITAGNYACLFNFSAPNSEERVTTLAQSSRIIFKNSKENRFSNRLSKTWILLLLIMFWFNM